MLNRQPRPRLQSQEPAGTNCFLGQMLKSFDFFPKLDDEVKVRTIVGAVVSVIAIISMLILFLTEFQSYLAEETIDRLSVDTTRSEKLKINFDITFPHIPCSLLSIDAMDVSGAHQVSKILNSSIIVFMGSWM